MPQPNVTPRRTAYTDQPIRDWHRQAFSSDYPCVDVDCLMVEYDRYTPCAIIEWKHKNAGDIDPRSANMRALWNLAAAAHLPLFVVYWKDGFEAFRVAPYNYYATLWTPRTINMLPDGFIKLIEKLREGPQLIPRL